LSTLQADFATVYGEGAHVTGNSGSGCFYGGNRGHKDYSFGLCVPEYRSIKKASVDRVNEVTGSQGYLIKVWGKRRFILTMGSLMKERELVVADVKDDVLRGCDILFMRVNLVLHRRGLVNKRTQRVVIIIH